MIVDYYSVNPVESQPTKGDAVTDIAKMIDLRLMATYKVDDKLRFRASANIAHDLCIDKLSHEWVEGLLRHGAKKSVTSNGNPQSRKQLDLDDPTGKCGKQANGWFVGEKVELDLYSEGHTQDIRTCFYDRLASEHIEAVEAEAVEVEAVEAVEPEHRGGWKDTLPLDIQRGQFVTGFTRRKEGKFHPDGTAKLHKIPHCTPNADGTHGRAVLHTLESLPSIGGRVEFRGVHMHKLSDVVCLDIDGCMASAAEVTDVESLLEAVKMDTRHQFIKGCVDAGLAIERTTSRCGLHVWLLGVAPDGTQSGTLTIEIYASDFAKAEGSPWGFIALGEFITGRSERLTRCQGAIDAAVKLNAGVKQVTPEHGGGIGDAAPVVMPFEQDDEDDEDEDGSGDGDDTATVGAAQLLEAVEVRKQHALKMGKMGVGGMERDHDLFPAAVLNLEMNREWLTQYASKHVTNADGSPSRMLDSEGILDRSAAVFKALKMMLNMIPFEDNAGRVSAVAAVVETVRKSALFQDYYMTKYGWDDGTARQMIHNEAEKASKGMLEAKRKVWKAADTAALDLKIYAGDAKTGKKAAAAAVRAGLDSWVKRELELNANTGGGVDEDTVCSSAALARLLDAYGCKAAFDEMRHKPMVYGLPSRFKNTDLVLTALKEMAGEHGARWLAADVEPALDLLATETHYHPALEWIHKIQWDGNDRFVELLASVETEQGYKEFWAVALWRWAMAAVRYLVNPEGMMGAPAIVFYDPHGGTGKDMWTRTLCPTELLATPMGFNPHDLNWMLAALNGWICVIPELAVASTKGGLEAGKAFLTGEKDSYAAKYKMDVVERTRRTIIIASTNQSDFLADRSGNNRRFCPIHVRSLNYRHKVDMQQFWAQMLAMFTRAWQEGDEEQHQCWLTEDEAALQADINSLHTVVDLLGDRIRALWDFGDAKWLADRHHSSWAVSTTKVNEVLDPEGDQARGAKPVSFQIRMARELARLGVVKKQMRGNDGKTNYYMMPPRKGMPMG